MAITSRSFDTCPVCNGRRFKGRVLPICDGCEDNLADAEFVHLYHRLRNDNAPPEVMQPFVQALIADCKDIVNDVIHARPVRKPRTKAKASKSSI